MVLCEVMQLSYQIVDSLIWLGIRDMINDVRKKKLKLRPVTYLSGSHGSESDIPHGYIWSPHLVPKPKGTLHYVVCNASVWLELYYFLLNVVKGDMAYSGKLYLGVFHFEIQGKDVCPNLSFPSNSQDSSVPFVLLNIFFLTLFLQTGDLRLTWLDFVFLTLLQIMNLLKNL